MYLDTLDAITQLNLSVICDFWPASQLAAIRAHRAALVEFRDYCWQQIG